MKYRHPHRFFHRDLEEQKVLLARAVDRLRREDHQAWRVLMFKFTLDLPQNEIADMMYISDATVTRAVVRGIDKLKAITEVVLDEWEAEHPWMAD